MITDKYIIGQSVHKVKILAISEHTERRLMMIILRNILTITLAVIITSTAVAMAVASGFERGGTTFDQALFIAIAISLTVLTHLLLALSKSKMTYIVWGGCLLATIFGQLVYFTHAAERAGIARVEKSQVSEHLSLLESQLVDATVSRNSIIARPLSVVARDFANETGYRTRAALKLELAEANRKISLDNHIATMKSAISTERDSEHDSISRDTIINLLSAASGVSGATISLIVSVTFAILIEVAGATLWYELLHKWNSKPAVLQVKEEVSTLETRATKVPQRDNDLFARLQQAVASGECKRTQNSIRQFLGCSQSKAGEFNKLLSNTHMTH